LSDTFLHALAASNRRAARSRSSPVSDARAGLRVSSYSPPLDCRALSALDLGDGRVMAVRDEPIAQLATRIPKELHRRLKLHCVTHEIAVQDFVTQAIKTEWANPGMNGPVLAWLGY